MSQSVKFDADLLRKYDQPLPRYTSCPPATELTEDFAEVDFRAAIAQQNGQLHRNFQGYTTKPESDLFGFGMTAISMLHDVYVQNHKHLKSYYRAIDTDKLPMEKGVKLDRDDIIRRTVIMEFMCQFQLSLDKIAKKYHLNFDDDFVEYFANERLQL